MHQHVLPMFLMPNMPMFCVQNCGCRNPDRAHCASCHQNSDKFKIKQRSEMCCDQGHNHSNDTHNRELEYLFVIDFECTCDEAKRLPIQEIIEFPIVVIDLKQKEIVDTFHTFVRPTLSPTLTAFCTKLTGISQEQVDSAPILEEVLKQVDVFLEKYLSRGLSRVSVLNDCDSDIRNFLRKEAAHKQIAVKPVFKEFIDLRRIYPSKILMSPVSIDYMLCSLGLEFEGVKHSGIADARNIARVALEIAKRDYVYTEQLKEHMHPYSNPHYYEHLVIIATQPKMKNNVELAMIAHDLRKGTTMWNNFGSKHVKNQEVKKELFDFLDKVGIDVDNSILCVQGKLENEFKGFFQGHQDNSNKDAQQTFTTKSNYSHAQQQSSSSSSSSVQDNNQESTSYKQNFFTTYFSLNKISRVAGVQVSPQTLQPLNNNSNNSLNNPDSYLPIRYSQRFNSARDINWPAYQVIKEAQGQQKKQMNQNNFSNDLAKDNLYKWVSGLHTYNNSFQSSTVKQPDSPTITTRLQSMCSVIESALSNGFIFTKDLASTIAQKRAFAQI